MTTTPDEELYEVDATISAVFVLAALGVLLVSAMIILFIKINGGC